MNIVITGCNRGIGLELAKQFAERGENVIGVCRKPSTALTERGIRVIKGIDVAAADDVSRLSAELDGLPIDVLINNAGILRGDKFGELDYDDMILQFRVNTLGPLRITEALAPNLREGSKVAIVSSRVGSIMTIVPAATGGIAPPKPQ